MARGRPVRMALAPLRDIVREGVLYRPVGPAPAFALHAQEGALPAGWCVVSFAAQAVHEFRVVLECEGGLPQFPRRDDIRLTCPAAGRARALVRLPESTSAIRLRPLCSHGGFSLDEIVVQPISRMNALMIIAWPTLLRSLANPVPALRFARQALAALVTGGLPALRESIARAARKIAHERTWATGAGAATDCELATMRDDIPRMAWAPAVSIIMVTSDPPEARLRATLDSVLNQIYPEWTLCVADNASRAPSVRSVLEEYRRGDARIRVALRDAPSSTATSANEALALATGDFIALLDPSDELAPDALYEIAKTLERDRLLDMVYSDEDVIGTLGGCEQRFFKPDWSPEYLESFPYTGRLAVYRKAIADAVGGFRAEHGDAYEYDFILRVTEQTTAIARVAKVLYHRAAPPSETTASAAEALSDRLRRTGRVGTVRQSPHGCFAIVTRLPRQPLVSVVIPTSGKTVAIGGRRIDLGEHCVRSVVEHSTYKNLDIIVVDDGTLSKSAIVTLSSVSGRRISYAGADFNFSKKINAGAGIARGDYLLLLNDDVEVISPEWIERMLEIALKPGVGVVGAKLSYPNGTLQHAGVAHSRGLPAHVSRHMPSRDPGYFFSSVAVRNYLAVTGACMLTSAPAFHRVRGLDERFSVNYNDADYCLRLREIGLRTVYTPHALLFHFESASRAASVSPAEQALYLARWSALTQIDPYYDATLLNTDGLVVPLHKRNR